jgi:hypothetical protein
MLEFGKRHRNLSKTHLALGLDGLIHATGLLADLFVSAAQHGLATTLKNPAGSFYWRQQQYDCFLAINIGSLP